MTARRRPGISREAIQAATRLLRRASHDPDALSAISYHEIVTEFEIAVARLAGARHAVAVSSGTAGLMTALLACGVGPGDEVIAASYGWGSTVAAVLALGAVPVFADIDAQSLCLDPTSVAECVGPQTRAILATHLFGMPADVHGLAALARSAGIRLVYDAAQALGATVDGQQIGAFGDATVLSLGYGKVLTTGEGGVVLTNDQDVAELAVLASQHPSRAFREIDSRERRRFADEVSLSLRLHPLAAAIGLAEVQRVPELIQQRRETCEHLADLLEGAQGFRVHRGDARQGHSWHVVALSYIAEELAGSPREAVLSRMHADGIPMCAGPVRTPIHLRRSVQSTSASRQKGMTPLGELRHTVDRCSKTEIMIEDTSRWLALSRDQVRRLAHGLRRVTSSGA